MLLRRAGRSSARLDEHEIAHDQGVQARIEKAAQRLARIADDRLALDVEGCVEHEIFARQLAKMSDEIVEKRMGFALDGLRPNRAVDMNNRGHLIALLRLHIEGCDHERLFAALTQIVVPLLR